MPERLRLRNALPYMLISFGVVILIGSFGFSFYQFILEHPQKAPLPDSLHEYSLAYHSIGKQAIEEINQLHGLKFPLTSGAVGVYGTEKQAILWISGTPARFLAKKLLLDMEARIAEGNSPFTPTNQITDTNRTIYELDGHGQKHYYFQSKKLLVWLAVDIELAESTLAEVLEFYP